MRLARIKECRQRALSRLMQRIFVEPFAGSRTVQGIKLTIRRRRILRIGKIQPVEEIIGNCIAKTLPSRKTEQSFCEIILQPGKHPVGRMSFIKTQRMSTFQVCTYLGYPETGRIETYLFYLTQSIQQRIGISYYTFPTYPYQRTTLIIIFPCEKVTQRAVVVVSYHTH